MNNGLGLLRCGVCHGPMVVQYNNPERWSHGRRYRNTPYVYACTRTPDGGPAGCQTPSGPHLDRAANGSEIHFALDEIDLAGLEEAASDRKRNAEEVKRLRGEQVEALARRARTLEEAIAEAKRP